MRRLPNLREIVHEQMLHRRVGHHDAQLGKPIGHAGPNGPVGALPQEHDGPRRPGEHRFLFLAHEAQRSGRGHGRRHDSQGLSVAPLAPTQLGHCLGVVRVAHEMEAPQSLHRQDLPRHKHFHSRCENRIRLLARLADELIAVSPNTPRYRRPALEAGIGLGVEAAVERIGILGSAFLAHGERRHGGGSTVVGQVIDDGEAWPTIRAVDKRVTVATVVRIEQLGHAVIAGGKLGRHKCGLCHVLIVGETNLEAVEILQRHFLDVDFLHLRCRRRVVR